MSGLNLGHSRRWWYLKYYTHFHPYTQGGPFRSFQSPPMSPGTPLSPGSARSYRPRGSDRATAGIGPGAGAGPGTGPGGAAQTTLPPSAASNATVTATATVTVENQRTNEFLNRELDTALQEGDEARTELAAARGQSLRLQHRLDAGLARRRARTRALALALIPLSGSGTPLSAGAMASPARARTTSARATTRASSGSGAGGGRGRARQRHRRGSSRGAQPQGRSRNTQHTSSASVVVSADPSGASFASLLEVARFAQHQTHRFELLLGALGHGSPATSGARAGFGAGARGRSASKQQRWMTPEDVRQQLEHVGLGGLSSAAILEIVRELDHGGGADGADGIDGTNAIDRHEFTEVAGYMLMEVAASMPPASRESTATSSASQLIGVVRQMKQQNYRELELFR